MTPEQEKRITDALAGMDARLKVIEDSTGARYPNGPSLQKALVKDDPAQPGLQPQEHLNVIQDLIDVFRGEVAAALARIEDAVSGG